ncbi:cation:proton antiporter [Peptostreptococcus russellii]|uniref:Sodium/proton-potassium antiporter GerN, CPA2 family n=1 Tax=Peptostreptococcus russellii TaxID=215200 RepID=A0A1H8J0G2_9FIRM|nr:cation:proton antiporter [Peptostreptococcus russellii]SEN73657.1 sodium/proton-potassium antiporter GerN, CPA2 family [Peptostreptococcus russellii]
MLDYTYLLSIAIILLSTKVFGGLTEKIHLPHVVGALVAGVIIGPSMLGIVDNTTFLDEVAQIGVIILMFMAGLDTDLGEIKRKGASYLLIAIMGVVIPLVGGFLSYMWFFHINPGVEQDLLKALFVGVVLTATSVSITIEALRELGQVNSRIGNAILGAAIVDDVLGIIVLTIITSFKDTNISISAVLLRMAVYFVCMFIFGVITTIGAKFLDFKRDRRRITVYVLALVFIISYISEIYVGIADITGAYLIGVIFSRFSVRNEIVKKVNVLSYLFFSPIFFASIGLKTKFDNFSSQTFIFAIILIIVAILTKIIGAGVGAKICKFTNHEALNIGIGMVSRGEVALIVAQKGYNLGLIDADLFSPIILMVVVTTIFTPIILKKTLEEKNDDSEDKLKDEDVITQG